MLFYFDLIINGASRFFENWFILYLFFSRKNNKIAAILTSGLIALSAVPYPNLARIYYEKYHHTTQALDDFSLSSFKAKSLYWLFISTSFLSLPGVALEPIAGIGSIGKALGKFLSKDIMTEHIFGYLSNATGILFSLFICSMFLRYEGKKTKKNVLTIINYQKTYEGLKRKTVLSATIISLLGTLSFALQSQFYTQQGVNRLFSLISQKKSDVADITSAALGYLSLIAGFCNRIMTSGFDTLNIFHTMPIYLDCLIKIFKQRSATTNINLLMLLCYAVCRLLEDYISAELMVAEKFGVRNFEDFSLAGKITGIFFAIIISLSSVLIDLALNSSGIIPPDLLQSKQVYFQPESQTLINKEISSKTRLNIQTA